MNQSLICYLGRETQECELAQGSVDPVSRRLHFELSAGYVELAGEARKSLAVPVVEQVPPLQA